MKAISNKKIEELLNALYKKNIPFKFESVIIGNATLKVRHPGKDDLIIKITAETKVPAVLEKISNFLLIPNIPELIIGDYETRINSKKQAVVNTNAIELLIQVTQTRNWHQGKIDRKAASFTKKNAPIGKVSYEKAVEILTLLGYQKIQEETWQAPQ